jgi:very-short-patch-repair endonuclease
MQYHHHLKQPARQLRSQQTDAEQMLWQRLRRKQMHGVQFYRQRPIDQFIVDFYCHAAMLVIECDGNRV